MRNPLSAACRSQGVKCLDLFSGRCTQEHHTGTTAQRGALAAHELSSAHLHIITREHSQLDCSVLQGMYIKRRWLDSQISILHKELLQALRTHNISCLM